MSTISCCSVIILEQPTFLHKRKHFVFSLTVSLTLGYHPKSHRPIKKFSRENLYLLRFSVFPDCPVVPDDLGVRQAHHGHLRHQPRPHRAPRDNLQAHPPNPRQPQPGPSFRTTRRRSQLSDVPAAGTAPVPHQDLRSATPAHTYFGHPDRPQVHPGGEQVRRVQETRQSRGGGVHRTPRLREAGVRGVGREEGETGVVPPAALSTGATAAAAAAAKGGTGDRDCLLGGSEVLRSSDCLCPA
jgi:hypothetical protein